MNLLPKTFEQFREKEYWDKFFVSRRNSPFEWYGDYAQMKSCLDRCLTTTDRLIVSGCGNSRLSADLYDVGFRRVTNVDISKVVIKQMKRLHGRKRPAMKWFHSDVTRRMSFAEDCSFDVVLDKGTLDALMTSGDEPIVRQIDDMFAEMERLLVVGGRYVCISLLQEHILKRILEWFLNRHWKILVCRNLMGERQPKAKNPTDSMQFPVFVVVCTKRDTTEHDEVLECSLRDKTIESTTKDALQRSVRVLQQYAFLKHDLNRGVIQKDDEVALDLCIGCDDRPKYNLFVIDRPRQTENRFGVFIVPHGRETEWLFGSRSGRRQLSDCAAFERLIVALLSRDHQFTDLDAIKAELSAKVMELSPKDLPTKALVPFLSVGEGLGKRNVRHRGTSQESGDYVVEDVGVEKGDVFRRLVFLNNPNVVQSEARLLSIDTRNEMPSVDAFHLACQHHTFMVAGLAFLGGALMESMTSELDCRVLVIGLGGGGLPTFIRHQFPLVKVTVVELDRSVYELAKSWFGFTTDDNLVVEIADGLVHAKLSASNAYDVVMVDVDNKDHTVGMSFPPESFVCEEALATFERILSVEGVFVLNLVCRNADLRDAVVGRVKHAFLGQCHSRKIAEEINEIVYAKPNRSCECSSKALTERFERLNARVQPKMTDELMSIDDMMTSLQLL